MIACKACGATAELMVKLDVNAMARPLCDRAVAYMRRLAEQFDPGEVPMCIDCHRGIFKAAEPIGEEWIEHVKERGPTS